MRPSCIEAVTLAQFATHYSFTSKVPKKLKFDEATGIGSTEDDSMMSSRVIFGSQTKLPRYLKLSGGGFMRLREKPAILRIHSSKKKEGHEQHYSELLLFTPWQNEKSDFERFRNLPEDCISEYNSRLQDIEVVRSNIFLGEDTIDYMECDLELLRPTHVYDDIDGQREQENEDDLEEGLEDDPRFAGLDHNGEKSEENYKTNLEQIKYKKVEVPGDEDISTMNRRLANEQLVIVMEVTKQAKRILRAAKSKRIKRVKPVRIIIHGGKDSYFNALLPISTFCYFRCWSR